MSEKKSYNVTYDNMKKLIKNHYAKQGRNVEVRISNEIDTDRFAGMVTTRIRLTERSTIGGVESETESYLNMDELKKIVSSVLAQEGKELLGLTNNAVPSSRIEGYGMGEHEVKSITGQSFTIDTREKEQTLERE